MNSILAFFILSVLAFGCAGRASKTSGAKSGYVPLSQAEAKIYITPTIYYIPQYDLAQQRCEDTAKKEIKDKGDAVLFRVCPDIFDFCLMQGTCELKNEMGRWLINVAGRVGSRHSFSKVQNKVCRFGFGASQSVCLDPFHSVAADLSIYRLGQVIYIPSAVGVELPDGTKHDGNFIVRDSGGAIKGYGRFDFFTGFFANSRSHNPLSRIGLADKGTHVQYFVLNSEESQVILKARNFPSLPVGN